MVESDIGHDDYVAAAGGAALGARLRRLSATIDADAIRVYAKHGVPFEQRWFGIMNQLVRNGPMTVGALASALGISHPSVSETRRSLEAAGHVRAIADPADARRRLLELTDQGHALAHSLNHLWQTFDRVAMQLDEEAGHVAKALDRLEKALAHRSLERRILDAL